LLYSDLRHYKKALSLELSQIEQKKRRNVTPRPKLDPLRLLAIKDILYYWKSINEYDQEIIDSEVNLVGNKV